MVVPAMQLFAARSGQAGQLPPGLNLPPSVLAKDQRSANNINGVFVLPIIMGALAISVGGSLVLGSAALAALVLAGCFGVGGVLAAWVASRAGTFERLLR